MLRFPQTIACATIAAAAGLMAAPSLAQRVSSGELYYRVDSSRSGSGTEGEGRSRPNAAGDTQTSCQLNDDHEPVNGIVGILSDLTATGFGPDGGDPLPGRAAESFDFLCDGEILSIEWEGSFLKNEDQSGTNVTLNCDINEAPTEHDNWTLRYWRDNPEFFLPGELMVEYTSAEVPVTRIDTGETNANGSTMYNMVMVFPKPVRVEAGDKFHVEIFNNYEFNECFFTWEVAFPGDGRAIVVTDGHPDGWNPDDVVIFDGTDAPALDYHYCQTFVSDPPVPNPPRATPTLERVPDPATGCCTIRYNIRNRNCLGIGLVETFYVAVEKGDAATNCEDPIGLSDLSAPPGYSVEFCEPWSNGRAIFKFTGGSIDEQSSTFGMIKTKVNGDEPVVLDPNNTVPPRGIRFWASQDPLGETLCGTGTFGPLEAQVGDWGEGNDAFCAFEPIPAMTPAGKGILALALVVGGLVLVLRSRSMRFESP